MGTSCSQFPKSGSLRIPVDRSRISARSWRPSGPTEIPLGFFHQGVHSALWNAGSVLGASVREARLGLSGLSPTGWNHRDLRSQAARNEFRSGGDLGPDRPVAQSDQVGNGFRSRQTIVFQPLLFAVYLPYIAVVGASGGIGLRKPVAARHTASRKSLPALSGKSELFSISSCQNRGL